MKTTIALQPAQRPTLGLTAAIRLTLSAIFSLKATLAVAFAVMAAATFHIATIPGTIEAQHAVGTDCLALIPWLLFWAIRTTRSLMAEIRKGGAL